MTKELEFHETAGVFPLNDPDDLANDILKHDQQVPIELLNGEILDGRRRYLACQKMGIEPRFTTVHFDDPMAALDHVISLNLPLRNLDYEARALAAGRVDVLREKYEREVKKGQLSGLKRGKGKPVVPERSTRRTRDLEMAPFHQWNGRSTSHPTAF